MTSCTIVDSNRLTSTRDIDAHEIVTTFQGDSTDSLYFSGMDKPTSSRHVKWIYNKGWIFVTNEAAFINHSCDPNCMVIPDESGRVMTRTLIKKGEEITISYNDRSMNMFPNGWIWPVFWNFECHCNSKNCIKYINRFV